MVALVLEFSKSSAICKNKSYVFFKKYKENKLVNEILGDHKRECKFYKYMDHWWHQACQIMKHITTLANDGDLPLVQSEDNCS